MKRNATTNSETKENGKRRHDVWESNVTRTCADCGRDLSENGVLTFFKDDRPLCLKCGGLSHLEFLPAGDAALTCRAIKHSSQTAVVRRPNPRQRRSDRLGLLVEKAALRRAREECSRDKEGREKKRAASAVRRQRQEQEYVEKFQKEILRLYPGCPVNESREIASRACEKHSGRVGRSAAAKELEPSALRNAVIAHIRHQHTSYDEMLGHFGNRETARERVRARIDEIRSHWESAP